MGGLAVRSDVRGDVTRRACDRLGVSGSPGRGPGVGVMWRACTRLRTRPVTVKLTKVSSRTPQGRLVKSGAYASAHT